MANSTNIHLCKHSIKKRFLKIRPLGCYNKRLCEQSHVRPLVIYGIAIIILLQSSFSNVLFIDHYLLFIFIIIIHIYYISMFTSFLFFNKLLIILISVYLQIFVAVISGINLVYIFCSNKLKDINLWVVKVSKRSSVIYGQMHRS